MQVTLKKAAALATSLAAIKVDTSTTVSLSAYSNKDIADEISEATLDVAAAVDKAVAINSAIYSIRGLIGKANEGEINSLLTQRAFTDKHLAILNAVINTAKPLDYDALKAQRASLLTSEANPYSTSVKALNVTIPTASAFTSMLKEAKKERIKIEDKLAQLNFSKTIELPEDVVAVLTDCDLI